MITNLVLFSNKATSGTVSNNLNYYVDWKALLKNKQKYKVSFNYQGGNNYINTYRFPYITTNLITSNVTTNNVINYNLGNLSPTMATNNIGCFSAKRTDNPELYLYNLPLDNNLNIQILDSISNSAFYDEHITANGSGTATQNGNILTVATATSGFITIGTVITISSIPRTVIGFISGTGGTGTYQVDISATIGTATAYTFPGNSTGNPPGQYILTLQFQELND